MIEIIQTLCPFPTVNRDKTKMDGTEFSQPKFCKKCEKNCWDYIIKGDAQIHHSVCPYGLSLVLFNFEDGKILSNGVIVKILNNEISPKIRKLLQDNKIATQRYETWHKRIISNTKSIDKISEKKAKELIDGVHNVKAAVNVLTRNAEAMISALPGRNDDEKIEGADPSLKALLKSVELLNSRLEMTSIISNPEAAGFGKKRPWSIYKIFHKMARLYEQLANTRNIRIQMSGESRNQPPCYDSIESLALVLVDNAVKYSLENKKITIKINDAERNTVLIEVHSYGLLIPQEIQGDIFHKYYRAPGSSKIASSGSGLGLYIAKTVADVHKFNIYYKNNVTDKNRLYGMNVFFFAIDDQGQE